MITKAPEDNIIAFDLLEWLAVDEPCPKKEVRSFLRRSL